MVYWSIMQKPDAKRNHLLRKSAFLFALFLFQTYLSYQLEQCELENNDDKKRRYSNGTGVFIQPLLRDIVSPRHAMVKLADAIDWKSFEDGLQECFAQPMDVPRARFV